MAIRKWTCFGLAAAISLILCTVSGTFLLARLKPVEDPAYDLSMMGAGEALPEDWLYDQKG